MTRLPPSFEPFVQVILIWVAVVNKEFLSMLIGALGTFVTYAPLPSEDSKDSPTTLIAATLT